MPLGTRTTAARSDGLGGHSYGTSFISEETEVHG